jgi:hypothetical protein
MRSELMASIYAKALVRKDYSGIVEKKDAKQEDRKGSSPSSSSPIPSAFGTSGSQTSANGKGRRKESKKGDTKDGTKNTSGADIGKIVNLMSGDANRIANMVSGAYFIYVSLPPGEPLSRLG